MLRGAEAFSAEQILALHKAPLAAIDGFAMANGLIEIAGVALAPNGDPRRVKVDVDPNIKVRLHYPLSSPGAPQYYWYWPNADRIAFKLDIDLAASVAKTDALRLTFCFDAPDVKLAKSQKHVLHSDESLPISKFPIGRQTFSCPNF